MINLKVEKRKIKWTNNIGYYNNFKIEITNDNKILLNNFVIKSTSIKNIDDAKLFIENYLSK